MPLGGLPQDRLVDVDLLELARLGGHADGAVLAQLRPLVQEAPHRGVQQRAVRGVAAGEPGQLHVGAGEDALLVPGVGHLDEGVAGEAGGERLEDRADRGQGRLVAGQQQAPGGAGTELDPAVVGADEAAVRAEHRDRVAHLGGGRPARRDPGAGDDGLLEVQDHVDVQLGVLSQVPGMARAAHLADRVGAHPAALGGVDLQPVAVPAREGVGIGDGVGAQRGEVVRARLGARDDQLDAHVQQRPAHAEMAQLGAGQGQAHEVLAHHGAGADREGEGELRAPLERGDQHGLLRGAGGGAVLVGGDGHGVLLGLVGRAGGGPRGGLACGFGVGAVGAPGGDGVGGGLPAQRQHHRGAGDRVGGDQGVEGEDLLDHGRGDHVGRGALAVDGAAVHGDEMVGVAGGELEVVQHDRDGGAAGAVQLADHVEHLELVGDVEIGGRLVQQQHLGALCERHGDPHPLALPSGELVEQTALELVGAGEGQRLGDRLLVLVAPLREQALVRVAAAGDQLAHGHPVGRERGLRQQAEPAGELLAAQGVDVGAVQQHRPLTGRQQARQAPQQSRLPRAVRADDHRHLPLGEGQVEVIDDDASLVGELQVPGGQLGHGITFHFRRSSSARASTAGTAPRALR